MVIIVMMMMMMMMMITRCTGLNCMFPTQEVRCLARCTGLTYLLPSLEVRCLIARCTGLTYLLPSREVRCLANNNNEYLERLTRTGRKRLHVLYKHILSKFSAYNMNARTHARTHTDTARCTGLTYLLPRQWRGQR